MPKKVFPFIIAALYLSHSIPASATVVPSFLDIQGRLTDSSGNPMKGPTQVDFYLFQGGSPNKTDDGVVVYKERSVITPGPDGTYSHHMGEGTPLESHSLTVDDFDTPEDLYLQIIIGGTTLLPRLKCASQPYAFLAKRAASVKPASVKQESVDPVSFQSAGVGLVPPGAILMFLTSCPPGFTEVTTLRNRLPIGTDVLGQNTSVPDSPNETLGSISHQHPIAHTHGTDIESNFAGTETNSTWQEAVYFSHPLLIKGFAATGGGDGAWQEGWTHKHTTISQDNTLSGAITTLPPALTVFFCSKN